MKYHIITYGCQMNKSDSERIAAVLEKIGCKNSADEKRADFIILNACSVRQTAVDRIYGKIKQLRIANPRSRASSLRGRRKSLIVLTGCLLPEDKKKLRDKADLILDIRNLPEWPIFLKKIINSQFVIRNSKIKKNRNHDYFKIKPLYSDEKTAYVPIMTGCDNFCSYCVVPYTRGREKSRPAEDIIREVKYLIKNDYKEIILLGQNVNSYQSNGDSLPSTAKVKKSAVGGRLTVVNFPKLLKLINDLPGDFKIRFITAHPKDMNNQAIKVLKLPKIANYLHLPVQSGSDRILKLMNRHYTATEYLQLIEKIRRVRPDIKIGTDIIVGFPTETKKDFQKTVELCQKAEFDNAYVAQYSPRPDTLATKIYKDNIPRQEKKRRWQILNQLINKKTGKK